MREVIKQHIYSLSHPLQGKAKILENQWEIKYSFLNQNQLNDFSIKNAETEISRGALLVRADQEACEVRHCVSWQTVDLQMFLHDIQGFIGFEQQKKDKKMRSGIYITRPRFGRGIVVGLVNPHRKNRKIPRRLREKTRREVFMRKLSKVKHFTTYEFYRNGKCTIKFQFHKKEAFVEINGRKFASWKFHYKPISFIFSGERITLSDLQFLGKVK